MSLGLTNGGGNNDFSPVFKFNAVSGDTVIASSLKNASGEWEKVENDVKFPAKFVFDFENIEIGWMKFAATGPSFHMVKLGERMPQRPDTDHKQGFRVKLYNKEHGVCIFSNSSKTIGEVMDTLHDKFLEGKDANKGKVPVVEIKGTEKIAVKTKDGSKNYKRPVWSIVTWIARPEALDAAPVEEAPAPAKSEDDDF